MHDTKSGSHAVVVGASIAGLLAARVLSRRFDRVTLVDRDALPVRGHRRGVPQGHHGHGLLASGLGALKTLFPNLESALRDAGAVPGDVIGDIRWFQQGYYKAKFHGGFPGLLLSRPLLEGTLRDQVHQIANVRVREETHVRGLLTDAQRRRVTGVRVQRAHAAAEDLAATLVVDTGGRAARSPEWLEALGYPVPAAESVDIGLGYTTRTFRRRPQDLGGDIGAIIAPRPPHQTRVGFALAMEGDRWIVTLGGWLGDHAPADPAGYLAFAQSLSRPDIYDLVKAAEPLTEAVTYAFPANLRRRYERLSRFPERYLVMGDALCSFNPFYGQGMSVAALEALALEACLAKRPALDALWRPFFKHASRIIDTPWMIACGSDFAFHGVTGPKPAATDAVNWYLDHVHRTAATDRVVCRAFFDVANLLKPSGTLFRPGVAARVLKGCFRPPAPAGASRPTWEIPASGDGPARFERSARA